MALNLLESLLQKNNSSNILQSTIIYQVINESFSSVFIGRSMKALKWNKADCH